MPCRVTKKPSARVGKTAERIFNRLIEAIVTGKIPSGLPFRESYFANRWGVSRTPMREAVRRAAETGFIVLRHNRTPIIRSFSAHEIASLYELRGLLETYALKMACDHIPGKCLTELKSLSRKTQAEKSTKWTEVCLEFDRKLHLSWKDNCKNPWLTESLSRIWHFIQILQRYMAKDSRLLRRSAEEHRQILHAIISGDKRRAIARLARHIRDSGNAAVAAANDSVPKRVAAPAAHLRRSAH